jgi:Calcium-activated chloride channel
VNIPNFMYFSSPEYSNGQPNVATLLQGSAICTETTWVPCPECEEIAKEPDTNPDLPLSRIGYVASTAGGADEATLWFALRNDCNGATIQQGMVNYATLWFVCAGVLALNVYLRYMEVKMDEDEQTAQDYSIVVENPPGDATDPEEWKQFFDATFGTHVTACTVAVNNDLLVQSLVERREVLRKIEMMVEPGTAMDRLTLAGIAAKEEFDRRFVQNLVAKVVPGLPELFARLVVLTAKVQGLAQQSYPATNVFVTFETEADQRRVLQALQCNSQMDRIRNNTNAAIDPRHLFRGTKLLSVAEAEEPSTIRWQDLNETLKERIKQQTITLVATMCAIALIAFIVFVCNTKYLVFTSFVIAIFNAIFPLFAKWLNSFESHASAGGVQRSLYCKIALFRWYASLHSRVAFHRGPSLLFMLTLFIFSQGQYSNRHYDHHSLYVGVDGRRRADFADFHALLCRYCHHERDSAARPSRALEATPTGAPGAHARRDEPPVPGHSVRTR